METSHSLAIESFSNSWLTNTTFAFDDLDEPLRTSLYICDDATSDIDTTCEIIITSKRLVEEPKSSNFDFPSSHFPSPLVHADEIFSNGKILPKYNHEESKSSNSFPSMPISSTSFITKLPNDTVHYNSLMKWRKSSKKVLGKYLGLLKPLCLRIGCSRKGIKVDDFDRKFMEMSSLDNSPQTSPPQSKDFFKGGDFFEIDVRVEGYEESDDFERNLRKSKSWSHFSPRQFSDGGEWSIDSLIYEAILYCKSSYEK